LILVLSNQRQTIPYSLGCKDPLFLPYSFIYVDDVSIASNDYVAISSFITMLNDKFKLKDLGYLKYFLGLEIAQSSSGISVSQ
jgi:hypothetical protein